MRAKPFVAPFLRRNRPKRNILHTTFLPAKELLALLGESITGVFADALDAQREERSEVMVGSGANN